MPGLRAAKVLGGWEELERPGGWEAVRSAGVEG